MRLKTRLLVSFVSAAFFAGAVVSIASIAVIDYLTARTAEAMIVQAGRFLIGYTSLFLRSENDSWRAAAVPGGFAIAITDSGGRLLYSSESVDPRWVTLQVSKNVVSSAEPVRTVQNGQGGELIVYCQKMDGNAGFLVAWAPGFATEKSGYLLALVPLLILMIGPAVFMAILASRRIESRIDHTITYLNLFSSQGHHGSIPPIGTGSDEFETLRQNLNALLVERGKAQDSANEANKELSRLNDELSSLNAELEERVVERTKQLIKTEKLAYLGSLVAGISHEVNTPIGTGFTAITFMHERLLGLKTMYETGIIERGEFEKTLAELIESSESVQLNLQRAAELLGGFKQISSDQMIEDEREIELASYLEQIHLSLKPRLKKSAIDLLFECQLGVKLITSPGALSQVITNLVENALTHGFDPGEPGIVKIGANYDEVRHVVRIVCEDNGKGIAPEHLPKIFHPFFTTRRGRGGTGLGLHIVFNTVTGKLGGTISVSSEPGAGARFTTEIPLTRSRKESSNEREPDEESNGTSSA